ncbi:MAG: class GN sortase [Alphaproteobacteria bacterium]|nr:class GN sortase [Alphaproteobacteria bacterium]
MKRQTVFTSCAVVLLTLGVWQIGAGSWIHAKAALAQGLLTTAWIRIQQGADSARPWPWADTWPVARLQVPRVEADMLVLAGGSGRTLAFGPGHIDGSAMPGGEGMSVVIGHRDTHFRFLRDLLPGDQIRMTDHASNIHEFIVRERHIVHMSDNRLAMDVPGLALVTCYPFDAVDTGGPLRYVVLAEPVSDDPPLNTIPVITAAAPAK